jgi:hypothetical protein
MQIYRLNRITDTNYRKFLKLVGFSPFSARPAKVDITFEKITIDKGIDAGTQVMTQVGTEKIVFEADEEYAVIPVVLKSVRTNFGTVTIDNTEANEKDDVYFAAFGGQAPLGATLSLGFDTQLPEKEISLTIDLFEDDLPSPGTHGEEPAEVFPSAEVVWEYLSGGTWKALALKSDTTSALTQSGRVNFTGPVSMDKKDGLYWVRGRLAKGGYEIIPEISSIRSRRLRLKRSGTKNSEKEQECRISGSHSIKPLSQGHVWLLRFIMRIRNG